MKKVLLPFLATLLLLMATVPAYGQGISAILERLDALESQIDEMGAAMEQIKGSGQAVATQDFSAYDQSLANLTTQLGTLKTEVSGLSGPAPATGPDSEFIGRVALLEQKNAELAPLLAELQTKQAAEIAEIRAAIAAQAEADISAPAAVVEPDTSDDLVISGFVDASYFHDGPTGHGSFGLDQVEVDIEKTIGTSGSLRVDLEWVSDGEGGFMPDVEQGYVTYSPDFSGEGAFTFGKFNAPIGFELLDAPDMFQYSHALVFNYGLPTNLTGLMYNVPFSDSWDLAAYVCNGWDVNVDPDKDKTIGGRLGFAGSNWGGGLSAIHGTETVEVFELVIVGPDTTEVFGTDGTMLTVFDIDLYLDPSDTWTMGGELNFGDHDLGETTASWWGFLVMSHWDFNSVVGTTIRFDYFDDKDASRLGGGVPEVRRAVAIAPTFVLGDGMGALIEARWDVSTEDVFTDSNDEPSKSAWALAFEMTYIF